jgi:four helix bundle protein
MERSSPASTIKPYDIHGRLLLFACDVVRAVQFLHTRGPIARALSYQILAAGTSAGANVQEADGASNRRDFLAKQRIALTEAKETRFRLMECRRCGLLDGRFDPLIRESDELVRILATIVQRTIKHMPKGPSEL